MHCSHRKNYQGLLRGWWARLSLIMLTAVSLSGCEQFDAVSQSLFMMSPDQEKQIGNEFAKQIDQQMEVVDESFAANYIQGIGRTVWNNSSKGEIEPEFHLVRDDSINAFAIPGGDVYIHTGLIKAADNEAELAGVIAHEVGHVIMRHGAAQVSRQTGIQTINQLLLGSESGQAAQIASSLLSQGAMFNYSREDERESDAIAVRALHNAGYDPMALRTFFEKLAAQSGGGGGKLTSFFSSHPPTAERMENVSAMVRSLPRKEYRKPVNELRQVQARLQQMGY